VKKIIVVGIIGLLICLSFSSTVTANISKNAVSHDITIEIFGKSKCDSMDYKVADSQLNSLYQLISEFDNSILNNESRENTYQIFENILSEVEAIDPDIINMRTFADISPLWRSSVPAFVHLNTTANYTIYSSIDIIILLLIIARALPIGVLAVATAYPILFLGVGRNLFALILLIGARFTIYWDLIVFKILKMNNLTQLKTLFAGLQSIESKEQNTVFVDPWIGEDKYRNNSEVEILNFLGVRFKIGDNTHFIGFCLRVLLDENRIQII
jgi:hypothetical protein